MPADSTTKAARKPEARSAVTNASRLIQGADGRTAVARRFRDVYSEIVRDLGGDDQISEAERQLIRRAASLSVYAETIEAKLAQGEDVDSDEWVRISNVLTRVLGAIGTQRRARDITPPDPLKYAEQVSGDSR